MPEGTRILFLTLYDERGPSSRIRIYQFLPCFEKAGFEVGVRPLLRGNMPAYVFRSLAQAKSVWRIIPTFIKIALSYLKRIGHILEAWSYDVVVVQKDVLPIGLAYLLQLGQKNIVYEFDDPIWMAHPGAAGRVKWAGKVIAFYRMLLLKRMLRMARLAVVDNNLLSDFSLPYCPNVLVLTSPIDTRKYKTTREPGDLPALGWIGSPSSTHLLKGMFPSLSLLAKQRKFVVYNLGGFPLHSDSFEIRNISWSLENEQKILSKMDVGLMPCDEEAFNQYRFGYKIVIYFSAGIPTIAPDIGLNRQAIRNGITGVLFDAQNPKDFIEKMLRLLDDESLRVRIGRNSRTEAENVYDLTIQSRKYIDKVLETFGLKPQADSRSDEAA